MSHTSTKNKSNLLEDIHKGIKLKSTKHLSNDRSSPAVNVSGPTSKNSSLGVALTLNKSSQIETPRNISNGPFQNKIGAKSQLHSLRPSASSSNISSSCKPPILRPKPKFPPSSSTLNISRNHSSSTDTRNSFVRMSSVDGGAENSCPVDASAKSNVESFATMKRSYGKKFLQRSPEFCPDRPRSNSFQQNRLVISSLFDTGSTSQTGPRKSSLVLRDSSDSCEVDGSRARQGVGEAHRAFEPKEMSRKAAVNNNAYNRINDPAPIVKHTSNNSQLPRSLRPLPPLPTKAPPVRQEREKVIRKQQTSFEDRFKFRGEKDFPVPPPFSGRKKFYQSRSYKNPAVNHHSRSAPLVTTV